MSKVRGRNTKPELRVRRLLHGLGYRFRLHDPRLPGRPDIVFSRRKRVVFVHGCFWHGHGCQKRDVESLPAFWRDKITRNRIRDAQVMRDLTEAGWSAAVIWECELKVRTLPATEEKLASFLGPPRIS